MKVHISRPSIISTINSDNSKCENPMNSMDAYRCLRRRVRLTKKRMYLRTKHTKDKKIPILYIRHYNIKIIKEFAERLKVLGMEGDGRGHYYNERRES